MSDTPYKKYTEQASKCVKGEAFFESLVCEYCIPHKVVGPKDIGIDYICEWVHGNKPTGILYTAQIKTFAIYGKTKSPKFIGIANKYNGLEKYEISNQNLEIDEATLQYWKSFGIPAYVFALTIRKGKNGSAEMGCYYKRYTPMLTEDDPNFSYKTSYFKANQGDKFLAFVQDGRQGFARDLFIDHVRWTYYKGSISYPDPQMIGLNQFTADSYFEDLLPRYETQVLDTYARTQSYLAKLGISE